MTLADPADSQTHADRRFAQTSYLLPWYDNTRADKHFPLWKPVPCITMVPW